MAWDGSGTYTRTNGTNSGATTWANDAAAGTKILSTRHDTHDEDIATAINACLTQNNESKPTAHFLPNADSSYNLGSNAVRWSVGYLDTLDVGGASTLTGAVSVDDVTDTSSGTTGSVHTDGGVGIAKKLYVGTDATIAGDLILDSIVQPKVKIIDIGDWDMDATLTVNVAHGLTLANIRSAVATIRNDANNAHWDLATNDRYPSGGNVGISATVVSLYRTAAGFFDDANYDSTSYNRGWITITYV